MKSYRKRNRPEGSLHCVLCWFLRLTVKLSFKAIFFFLPFLNYFYPTIQHRFRAANLEKRGNVKVALVTSISVRTDARGLWWI